MSFVHPKSDVDAAAKLGRNVYIAAFASIRADEGSVEVGNNASIQESCVVHGKNVRIGNNVTVGHGAIVHGCRISDNALIGMNATLLNNCEIGEWSIVAAGAVVTEGMKVPPGSIVAGVPAKILRPATEADKKLITGSCENYLQKLRKMGLFE
ncbi:Carbonic anhydrase [uncultured archaeon]|nr:Carbonic anhydrase [uncultured archaeon]